MELDFGFDDDSDLDGLMERLDWLLRTEENDERSEPVFIVGDIERERLWAEADGVLAFVCEGDRILLFGVFLGKGIEKRSLSKALWLRGEENAPLCRVPFPGRKSLVSKEE